MPPADAPRDGTLPLAFHPHRIVIDAGVLIALAGLSLAFVSTGSGARPWSLGDGAVLLGLLAPLVVLTALPDRSRPLSPLYRLIGGVLLLVTIPYALIKVLEAFTLARALGGSAGLGPWLVLAGVATAAVGVGLSWRQGAEYLPPPPRIARSAPPPGEYPQGPRGAEHEAIEHDDGADDVSWLDENPFGEPLFDSVELEVPPLTAGEPVPDDYDEPWPIEDRPDGFHDEATPPPPRDDNGHEPTDD